MCVSHTICLAQLRPLSSIDVKVMLAGGVSRVVHYLSVLLDHFCLQDKTLEFVILAQLTREFWMTISRHARRNSYQTWRKKDSTDFHQTSKLVKVNTD